MKGYEMLQFEISQFLADMVKIRDKFGLDRLVQSSPTIHFELQFSIVLACTLYKI